MEPSAERVAHNQSTFREANERIEAAAEEHQLVERVPFLCECSNPRCTEIVRLTLREYEAVRDGARMFFVASGHQIATPPEMWREVAQRDGYVVVEKVGDAGEVAEALYPRSLET